MPRKSKKNPESDPAVALEITPYEPTEVEAADAKPAKKTARKTRSRKPATPPADAEATAQAADTSDDAMEVNGPGEIIAETAAPEEPKKKSTRARKAKASAEPEPAPEPQPAPQPESQPGEIGPDEDDELAGDWESGSGPSDEEEPAKQPQPPAKLERLQKILAAAGVASRRHAEELITEGRVQVNGKVVTTLGSKADAARDHIRVDGKLLHGAERLRYFVLNKPRAYVTTVSDPEGRPTVMEFFSKMGERLYPVGRLDYESEGLLLMTNDGDLANRLTRAASGVEKTYLVKVSGQPDEDLIDQLRQGIGIDRARPGEGRVQTAPAQIRQVRTGENPWFEVSLIEGRNRELRKMFEEIGHHVEKIRRVGYGPLVLDQEPGHYRELEPEEVQLLRLAAEGKWKPKRIKATTMLPKEAGRSADHAAGKRGGKPFRGRENRGWQDRSAQVGRGPARSERSGERREGSRPGYGRPQERGNFERPAFRQGGFAARPDRPGAERSRQDRPQPNEPRGEQPRREGGFEDRRGPRRESPRRSEFERGRPGLQEGGLQTGRPARGGSARAQGGFAGRGGDRRGNARPSGGFAPRRDGGFSGPSEDRRQGGAPAGRNRFEGPRGGGRSFEDRGGNRERPRFSGARRPEGQGQGGQRGRFGPRPEGTRGSGGGGGREIAPRTGEPRGGDRPQGRPAGGNFGGGPRAGGANRGPNRSAGARTGGPARGAAPERGGSRPGGGFEARGGGGNRRPGGARGPARGPGGNRGRGPGGPRPPR